MRGRPHYDERRWFRCLAEADQHDNARRLANSYQTQDLAQHYAPTSNYFERLYASLGPKMNGKILHLTASDPEVRTLHAIRAST